MHRLKDIKFLMVGLVALTVFFNGCSDQALAPSSSTQASGSMSGGEIKVTVMDGSAPASPARRVALIAPDGSKQILNTGSDPAGGPAAVFGGLTQEGDYKIQLEDQSSVSPAVVTLPLSESVSKGQVQLQVDGSAISLVPAPFQAQQYTWAAQQFNYTLTYANQTDLQEDLALSVDPLSLPPGWTVHFDSKVLRPGESTALKVFTADGSQGLAALKVLAKASRSFQLVTTLAKGWQISITRNIYQRDFLNCGYGNIFGCNFSAAFEYSVSAFGLPPETSIRLEPQPATVVTYTWAGYVTLNPPSSYFRGWVSLPNNIVGFSSQKYTGHYWGGVLQIYDKRTLWLLRLKYVTGFNIGSKHYEFSDEVQWQNQPLATGSMGIFTTTF